MSDEAFPAWITKYALTEGILEISAQPTRTPTMIRDEARAYRLYNGEGKDWHRSKEQAIACAQKMRTAKIASLRKSIAKLERLVFE